MDTKLTNQNWQRALDGLEAIAADPAERPGRRRRAAAALREAYRGSPHLLPAAPGSHRGGAALAIELDYEGRSPSW
ncbi:hypothetical protein [Frondihabitans sucicola]|nr:hypothetical protein [Frondihabitans sucicola]